jgi:cyclopropane-fatty-acyl-phospholipid synthase
MVTALNLDDVTPDRLPEENIQIAEKVEIPQEVRAILKRGGLYELGEAFIRGEWSHNDLAALMLEIVSQRGPDPVAFRKMSLRFLASFLMDRLRNSQHGDRAYEVARHHYDLGNDLFKAMLDRNTMTYTCGYWNSARTLEEAQEAKIDLLCRKLGLTPGMRVLDIGCGWGNFAQYAAMRYGVSVVGLTVSKEQASLARERCKGLPVEIVVEDYRNFSGQFDRIVSIEMIEAVGRKNMRAFFRMVHDCLAPKGLFGLQVISAKLFSRNSSAALDQYILWLQKRIFPNGYLPDLSHLCAPDQEGLVIEDLHNFSVDYAKTLCAWSERFQKAWPMLQASYGEPFRRMWLYYLHGCEAMFRTRLVQLYQIVYSKGGVPEGYRSVRDERPI